ncbi:MAG: ABC transporter permease, partial [Bacteroidetes bacterium]|nr:ABC transporter permease [Bacteroidota bacterium]
MKAAMETIRVRSHGRLGPLSALKRFIFELRNGRVVVVSLFNKNYLQRFADTALGKVWVIITPVVPIVLYNFLQIAGLFGDPQSGIPRSVFLSYGLTLYYCFSETLVSTTGIITNNRGVIVSSGTSKVLLGFSEILGICFNFSVRSILFWVILGSMEIDVGIRAFTILLWGGLMMAFGYIIGLTLSLFAVIYKDITNFLQIIAFYLLFASGVFTRIVGEGLIW